MKIKEATRWPPAFPNVDFEIDILKDKVTAVQQDKGGKNYLRLRSRAPGGKQQYETMLVFYDPHEHLVVKALDKILSAGQALTLADVGELELG